jgi:murein DD-endopeptidase MepM/ murein hydrolase activator NlpD
MIRLFALAVSLATALVAAPIELRLPTDNQHLFTGELEKFYMYVDRTFEGVTSQPWEAGSFGFVRTAMRVNNQVLLTKFHEGIDISPVKRDRAGNPLDLVSSIAAGQVVYISPIAGRSNYGKYVVVAHAWEDSTVLSLYAHLADITCSVGDPVKAGSVLGRMGYTGAGLNRTRAHLHLELGFLSSAHYESWHKTMAGGINHHGLYNGMNIIGTDVARFFIEHRENPARKFSEFVATTPVYFKVTVPGAKTPDFAVRYPWIVSGSAEGAVSWEISFSATGQPVAFSPSQREVRVPTVTSVRPSEVQHRHLTRGLLIGEGNRAELSPGGKKLVALVTDDFPISTTSP